MNGIPVRLFVALQIPDDVRNALNRFVEPLRSLAPRAKWVRAENLHVTLNFLGNTDPLKVNSIKNALSEIQSGQPVTLNFRGLGFFPNERRPRVFWVGIEASTNLAAVAARIDRAIHAVGFPSEDRPFAPHLTLARFDAPTIPPRLVAAIDENAFRNFGSTVAHDFHLIESKLRSTGAEYTSLQSFQFVTERPSK